MARTRAPYDRARFYDIGNKRYPSVTTILGIIDKSGPLMHWAVNEERKHFEAAILELVTSPGALPGPDQILDHLSKAVSGVKAADRAKNKAGEIGTLAHAMIEWETNRRMGKRQSGSRPTAKDSTINDAAVLAYMAWEDWAKDVKLLPLMTEATIGCNCHGYAGMFDLIARVKGKVTLGDYKTGKAVYPEAYLQNIAYRHGAHCSLALPEPIEAGLIIRLPKTLDQPSFEAAPVPEATALGDFLAAQRLWRWNRRMQGLPTGDPGRHG